MITLSTSPDFINVSGDTYTVRHHIRKAGGLWMAAPGGAKGGHWRVPNNPANLAAMEALATGSPIPEAPQAPEAPAVRQAATPAPAVDLSAYALKRDLAATQSDLSTLTHKLGARLTALEEMRPTVLHIAPREEGLAPIVIDSAHVMLPHLIQSLAAGLHVWIAGPSGSGKTHGAEQAAKALALTFRLQGAMTMAHELTGFVDAGGKYHETPFVTSFRTGGLILLDELDAGSNEALLALNAALANGVMCLPSGEIIRAHADFKCIGSANTFGAGATAEYVGRTRIDAAFLQRFGARLTWGYDEALERAISGNEGFARRVQKARANAKAHGIKVLITPRASQAGARLIAAGYTSDEAASMTYLADLTPEQRRTVEAA